MADDRANAELHNRGASFWLFFVYTVDNGGVQKIFVRSQKVINRLFGGPLIFRGIRVAAMER